LLGWKKELFFGWELGLDRNLRIMKQKGKLKDEWKDDYSE